MKKIYFNLLDIQVLGSCVFIGPYFKEIKKKIKERVCTLTSKTYQLHVALHKCSLSPVFPQGVGKEHV